MHIGISVGEALRAVALGLVVLQHMAGGVQAARLILAGIHQRSSANASVVGISDAAIHAGALIAAGHLSALGVLATGLGRAATAFQRLTASSGITKEVRRAGALSLATHHPALGICSTSSVLEAGISALSLVAALVAVAIGVHAALELHALLAGLALVAVGAVAEHSVLGDSAQGISATGLVIRAGVRALATDAALVGGTVSVGLAAGNAGSTLAKLTHRTLALGSALVPALFPGTLLSARAVLVPRALGGTVGAVLVAFAAGMAAFRRQLAARQAVANEGCRALALDAVVDHQAVGTLTALTRRATWVLALLVHASLVAGTGQVRTASGLAHAVLADLSLRAGLVRVADGPAGSSHAPLVRQAVLVVPALALAAARVAELVRLAVLVPATGNAGHLAGHVGIAVETIGAGALLPMIDHLAEGVGAAGSGIGAGIHALLTHAGQVLRASLIRATAGHTIQAQTELAMAALVVVAAQRLAHSLLAAFVGQAASIVGAQGTADRLEAGQPVATVAILAAFQGRGAHAAHLGRGIGHHAVQAAAAGSVVGHCAGGIGAAGTALQTGVHALVVATGLGGTAVVVHMAAIDALVVQADVAQEAVVVHATGH